MRYLQELLALHEPHGLSASMYLLYDLLKNIHWQVQELQRASLLDSSRPFFLLPFEIFRYPRLSCGKNQGTTSFFFSLVGGDMAQLKWAPILLRQQ